MSQPQPKAFPVSWDQFHRDARALAWRLAGAGPFQAIVCITRGGLVPAAIVARELGVRVIETVCVASYHDYTSQGELQVLKKVADDIAVLYLGRMTAQVEAKDVNHSDVVKLITGGSLVEEGGHVAVADATDEPDDDEPGTGGTGAQA